MKKYYHMTSYENLDSISKNGLVPMHGGRTRSIGDKREAVFLSLGIRNSILMYGSLLHYYNSHAGNRGLEAIEFYKKRLKDYQERAKIIPPDEEDIAEMEAIPKAIKQIEEMMEYKDFSDYLGEGVYLTVSGVTNINTDNPIDCYSKKAIPPKKIKVVLLRNRETGEIIDNREDVLSYFLSLAPSESILYDVHNVITRKIITDLYAEREDDILYYKSGQFEIEEVPIDSYVTQKRGKVITKKF